ncbi:hypothetical protein EKK58_05785 [Candidatus Dependentiae bacterium]|nr:MAG: hypothetical protein EKK58_05785 [Candidatus Dependentiae bacterium]
MAQADWTELIGSAPGGTIRRAVSAAYPKPPGGGTFARGFNSQSNAASVVAYYHVGTGFTPTTKGGDISSAIQRGLSAGKTNFSPFIFICLTGTNVADNAYILGPADGDPSRMVLRKGDIASGLPNVAPGQQGVLRQSSEAFPDQAYYHLRLEAVKNGNDDMVINCYRSNLLVTPVSDPAIWVPIPGMDTFIDDNAGIESGSLPLASGYLGYGFRSSDISRRAYFDHIRPRAQT